MKRTILLLVILLLAFSLPLAAQNSQSAPFRAGEELLFNIKVMGYDVGTQQMRLIGTRNFQGENCWLASADTRSNPELTELARNVTGRPYQLHDVFMTYMRTSDLHPLRVLKRIHEGGWEDNVTIDFNPDSNRGIYRNKRNQSGQQFSWQGRCLDVLSMVYYIRSQRLNIGDRYTFSYLDEKTFQTHSTTVVVESASPIQIGSRNIDVIRVRKTSGDSVGGIDVEMYLTNTASRIPLKITIGAFKVANYGTINIVGNLINYTPGQG